LIYWESVLLNAISNYVVYNIDMLNLFPIKCSCLKAAYILDPLLCLGISIKFHNMSAYFCYSYHNVVMVDHKILFGDWCHHIECAHACMLSVWFYQILLMQMLHVQCTAEWSSDDSNSNDSTFCLVWFPTFQGPQEGLFWERKARDL